MPIANLIPPNRFSLFKKLNYSFLGPSHDTVADIQAWDLAREIIISFAGMGTWLGDYSPAN